MREWFIGLWTDEARFVAIVRGVIGMAGVVLTQVDGVPEWIGQAITAAALFINAGDKAGRE